MKVGNTGRVALVSKSARVLASRDTTSSDINKKIPTEINAFKRGNDVSNDSVFKTIKNAPTRKAISEFQTVKQNTSAVPKKIREASYVY